jgi:hypothetical protein
MSPFSSPNRRREGWDKTVKEYSPFTPGVPVPLEFFVGRAAEVQEIM